MKKLWIGAIIPICAALAFAASEKPKEPFYEKYLTDEDPGDRAIRDLTRQIGEKPDDASLHNDLGNLLARRGFAKEAVEQYRLAARLNRSSYLPSYNEGLLWEKEGKPLHAMSAFRRSIRLKPGFPFSHFHLGVLEEKDGREAAAVAELAKALRIDNSLRLPSRNPLAVQTRLLHRASVANYERDLASAVLVADGEFDDPAVLARISPERFIDTKDIAAAEEDQVPDTYAQPAAVPLPQSAPPSAAAPPSRRTPDSFLRSRPFSQRPRSRIPSRIIPTPSQPSPPPPAAEPPPEEPPPETPPEEEPPPPLS
jgi:hypothetical protein